jgi:hypothetical protein
MKPVRQPLLVPVFTAVLFAACGGGSDGGGSTASSPASAIDSASGTPASAPVGQAGSSGSADPVATAACSLLSPEQQASILGEALSAQPFLGDTSDSTDCTWSASDGSAIGFKITFFTPPDTWLLRTGTPVAVGDEAYVSGDGATLALEADIKGWLVDIWTPANPTGAVTADAMVALGQLLDSVLIANPNDISPGGPGAAGSAPPVVDGGGAGLPGSLIGMSVAIDAPGYLAGSVTASEADIAANFGINCNVFGDFLEVGYRVDAAAPGMVAQSLSFTAAGVAGSGTYPAEFNFLAEVQPPGSSFPFVEFFAKPGEVTWDGGGAFSFTISDDGFGNSISGSVSCSFR